jgi:hypothetical protein
MRQTGLLHPRHGRIDTGLVQEIRTMERIALVYRLRRRIHQRQIIRRHRHIPPRITLSVREEQPIDLDIPPMVDRVHLRRRGRFGTLGELGGEVVRALTFVVDRLHEARDDGGDALGGTFLEVAEVVAHEPHPGSVVVVDGDVGEVAFGGVVCAEAGDDVDITADYKNKVVNISLDEKMMTGEGY